MNRSFLPNLITCLNLFSGCVAVVLTAQGMLVAGSYFILLAAFFDFMDGFVARWIKGDSALGMQLDSLADMVTFGFYPGFLLFQLISASMGVFFTPVTERTGAELILPFAGFFITIFAALRLTIFNLSTDQSTSFKDLPTPAMTFALIFIPGFAAKDLNLNELVPLTDTTVRALSHYSYIGLASVIFDYRTLIVISVILSFLMVSPFRFIAFKFKGSGFRRFVPMLLVAIPSIAIIIWLMTDWYFFLPLLFSTYLYMLILLITSLFFPGIYEVQSRN